MCNKTSIGRRKMDKHKLRGTAVDLPSIVPTSLIYSVVRLYGRDNSGFFSTETHLNDFYNDTMIISRALIHCRYCMYTRTPHYATNKLGSRTTYIYMSKVFHSARYKFKRCAVSRIIVHMISLKNKTIYCLTAA